MEERIISPIEREEDTFEKSLRPQFFSEYIGQDKVKNELGIYIQAAKQREESLDHVLLYGPPGLGKTTMAMVMAWLPCSKRRFYSTRKLPTLRRHRDWSSSKTMG